MTKSYHAMVMVSYKFLQAQFSERFLISKDLLILY